jgi:hypothetical protein
MGYAIKEPDHYCNGCDHWRGLHDHIRNLYSTSLACLYILDTYKARGCPFGDGCPHHTLKGAKE